MPIKAAVGVGKVKAKPQRLPTTHDYTNQRWGHACGFEPVDGGLKGRANGWGKGVAIGDYLLLQNGSGSSRYKVTHIHYVSNPPDQWFAKLEFAPRTTVEI